MDILKKYPDTNPATIFNIAGVLPLWVARAIQTNDPINALSELYGFPVHQSTGATINPDTGVYSYPDDPDLYPLFSLSHGVYTAYIYEYALVAVFKTGEKILSTRMD